MCFLPGDISLKIGVNFQAVRLLTIVGFISVYLNNQRIPLKFNSIDYYFFSYNILMAIVYVLASVNTKSAIIFQAGQLVDSILLYLFIRNIVQNRADIGRIAKVLSVCIIVLIPFIFSEFFFQKNFFSIVGRPGIVVRQGEVRAAGSFSHAILMGSFAAALIPFLWASFRTSHSKKELLAVISCLFFIYACSSSGPIVCTAGMFFFMWFFKYRLYSKLLARLMLAGALTIHLVREYPIWQFLYLRITIKASSTGRHRYLLMDAAIKEFKNWWLSGYGDVGPAWHLKYWPWTHATFTDVTNHYLLVGVRGGMVAMLLFMITCYKSVVTLGHYSFLQKEISEQYFWWGIAVMMIGHCITFLSVSYFGQITLFLYMGFAIAALAQNDINKVTMAID
jgi:hypothetical protein